MRRRLKAFGLGSAFSLILTAGFAGPASAASTWIEALYAAPGGGTAQVTGIYDDTGFSGSGTEIFHFLEVDLVFSAGGSFLAGTSHHQDDMFGVAFQNGLPVDLVNHNNTAPNGKSLQIFGDAAGTSSYGIYMADSGSTLDVEGWWVVNHQAPQRHSLTGFNGPLPVSEPSRFSLLAATLVLLALYEWGRSPIRPQGEGQREQ